MPYFVEFYRKQGDVYHPAVGDRSVYILDGRNRLETLISDGRLIANVRNFDAFRIARGRFTRPHYLSPLVTL